MSIKSARPLSRASTTSIHSYEQHTQSRDNQAQFQQQSSQQPQLQNGYPHSQYNASYASLEPIIQAANHVNQQDGMPIEAMQQLIGYAGDSAPHHAHSHSMNSQSFDQNHVIQLAMNHQQQYTPVPVEVEEKKKKGSASGAATNDKELREMLVRNGARELKDVAAEVIATDRTSKAEKSKQLFAMLWYVFTLNGHCIGAHNL
jgi:regulatory factor X